MFVELARGYWNLETLTNYRKDERSGAYSLVFPVDGGNVTVKASDPHYGFVDAYLSERTPTIP